jgi:hypothetical protein
VPVHEYDIDVALLQLLRGADSGESSAQDHDPMAASLSGHETEGTVAGASAVTRWG